jgi:hypothetical protein
MDNGGEEEIQEDNPNNPPPQAPYFPRAHLFANTSNEPSRITSGLWDTIKDATSFEDGGARLFRRHLAQSPPQIGEISGGVWKNFITMFKNFKEDKWGFVLISAKRLALFTIFIGEQVMAITAAGIVTGSTALSASPNCGVWKPDTSNVPIWEGEYRLLNFVSDPAFRAATYAETCCGENSTADACNTFYRMNLKFEENHNSSCPFDGDGVCLFGENSAYSLDTGYLDSNILGINGVQRYQFRRRTSCAPLVVNTSYIRFGEDDAARVDYFYGNSVIDLKTYSDFVNPSWQCSFDLSNYKVMYVIHLILSALSCFSILLTGDIVCATAPCLKGINRVL